MTTFMVITSNIDYNEWLSTVSVFWQIASSNQISDILSINFWNFNKTWTNRSLTINVFSHRTRFSKVILAVIRAFCNYIICEKMGLQSLASKITYGGKLQQKETKNDCSCGWATPWQQRSTVTKLDPQGCSYISTYCTFDSVIVRPLTICVPVSHRGIDFRELSWEQVPTLLHCFDRGLLSFLSVPWKTWHSTLETTQIILVVKIMKLSRNYGRWVVSHNCSKCKTNFM